MKPFDVVVVDYGLGNLLSVQRGFEHWGATVRTTSEPDVIRAAPRVVLPGVGAFSDGMSELRRLGLDKELRDVAARGTPLLGICLGMQMLFDESEEFGTSFGLGLIPGQVLAIPANDEAGRQRKVPHIGWNALIPRDGNETWHGKLLDGLKPGDAVYFVHSFMAVPANPEYCVAQCAYEGVSIAAIVERENVFGCQFHPEKSGEVGLAVLKRFLAL